MKLKHLAPVVYFSCMLFMVISASAQNGKIPPFKMLQANGKLFRAQDLPMGKPVVIIYFSPDCDHCTNLMNQFFRKVSEFKKASVAMITYLPVSQVAKFNADYKVNSHHNLYVGTEGSSFFVRNYYKITQIPFMALYTKNGDLVKLYPKEGGLADLSARLKAL